MTKRVKRTQPMTEADMDKVLAELMAKIIAILKEHPLFDEIEALVIMHLGDTRAITGAGCPVCMAESLNEYIIQNNIQHVSAKLKGAMKH